MFPKTKTDQKTFKNQKLLIDVATFVLTILQFGRFKVTENSVFIGALIRLLFLPCGSKGSSFDTAASSNVFSQLLNTPNHHPSSHGSLKKLTDAEST
jgi:hypothetical protein